MSFSCVCFLAFFVLGIGQTPPRESTRLRMHTEVGVTRGAGRPRPRRAALGPIVGAMLWAMAPILAIEAPAAVGAIPFGRIAGVFAIRCGVAIAVTFLET